MQLDKTANAIPYHARGIAYIDAKLFDDAIDDFTVVIKNYKLRHRDYVLSSCHAFRVISYCALGDWINASKNIDFVDDKFVTYQYSIEGMISKQRLIDCIHKKTILQ